MMTAKTPSQPAADQDISRVRDILLGPQMREYEQRFQMLQRDVDRLQKLFEQITEHTQEQTEAHAMRLASQISEQDMRLSQRLVEESTKATLQIQEIAERLTHESTLQTQRANQETDRFDKQLVNLEASLSKKLQAVQREARTNTDELRQELREMVDSLTHNKTDRQSLGQMLVEMGSQLIGNSNGFQLDELLADLPTLGE